MILITGGMGFIGLHTARSLIDMGEQVVLTQYRVAREPDFIRAEIGTNAFVEQLDVTDGEALLALGTKYKVDGLDPPRDARPRRPRRCGRLSHEHEQPAQRPGGSAHLGGEATGIASSVTVYGGIQNGPFTEDMPLRTTPANAVEAYKKAYEVLSTHYAQRANLDIVLLRIAGIWGPLYHSMGNNISRLVHAAVKGVEPELRGDIYEGDAQDYCYVKDCGRGIALLQSAPQLNYLTYNIGGGRATMNGEIAEAIRRQIPNASLPMKPGVTLDRHRPYMDLARIKQDVGYEPVFSLDAAIADYVAWLKENPE